MDVITYPYTNFNGDQVWLSAIGQDYRHVSNIRRT